MIKFFYFFNEKVFKLVFFCIYKNIIYDFLIFFNCIYYLIPIFSIFTKINKRLKQNDSNIICIILIKASLKKNLFLKINIYKAK